MAEYTLYCFAQSGNCYKAALMLELAAADWRPRFVDYFNGETRTPEYRASVNEMGEAPVLEHAGRRYSQSGVILDYLAERYPRFGPRDADERRDMLRWLLFDNHKLTSYTGTYRFLRTFARDASADVMAEFRRRAEGAWGVLDGRLAGRRYVVGERLTYVDLSLCAYLFFDDEIGVDWNGYPNIRDWLARLRDEPGWRHPYELMPGHPLPTAA
jgi:glutathione S-transferase